MNGFRLLCNSRPENDINIHELVLPGSQGLTRRVIMQSREYRVILQTVLSSRSRHTHIQEVTHLRLRLVVVVVLDRLDVLMLPIHF